MKVILRIFFVIPLILMLTSCATDKKFQNLETKVDVLENKVSSIGQRQAVIEGQAGESRESVGYLKGKVETVSQASPTVVVTNLPGNGGCLYKSDKVSLTRKKIQIALKNAGFYNGPIDGKIGKNTKKAIREFQKANSLKADGIVGAKTKSLLIQHLEQEVK